MNEIGLINKLYYEWWKNIDKSIFFLIIILFSLGLFFSLVSTSLIASDKLNTNSYYFFVKHLTFIFLGLSVMFLFSLVKENYLIKLSMIFGVNNGISPRQINIPSTSLGISFKPTLRDLLKPALKFGL